MHHLHNMGYISEYIRSFGYLAPLVALFLFVLQSVLPIFPYAVLVAMAVILFGAKLGFGIALLGAMLGSILCYQLCCSCGVEWLNRKIMHHLGYDTSKINTGIAFGGIVMAHLIQLVPNSLINIAAAVSRVPPLSFSLATALGLIPITLAYTGLGLMFYYLQDLSKALPAAAAILLFLFLVKKLLVRSWSKDGPSTLHVRGESTQPLLLEKAKV